MAQELKKLKTAMWAVITDPRASRIERIEAGKIVAACSGILIPELDERWLSVRQITQLRHLKQQLLDQALRRKERKRKQNRRAFLRRKIRSLEAQKQETE